MRSGTAFSCFISTLLLAACAPDKDPLDTISTGASAGPTGSPSGGPSGDPSGGTDTASGGTDSGTGGVTEGSGGTDTGGSGLHGDCDQLILCVGVVSPESLPQIEEAYGPNSSCWQLTPEIEQMCLEACATSLDSYGMLYPDEPACGGTPGSTTSDSGPVTSTTDPSTTTTDPSGTTTNGGGEYGNCGWDGANGYYACGYMGEDPEGASPIACPPNLPQDGDPCTEDGPINSIGCCVANGDNYYCGGEVIVVESCGA